jgi:hypothetical protein
MVVEMTTQYAQWSVWEGGGGYLGDVRVYDNDRRERSYEWYRGAALKLARGIFPGRNVYVEFQRDLFGSPHMILNPQTMEYSDGWRVWLIPVGGFVILALLIWMAVTG